MIRRFRLPSLRIGLALMGLTAISVVAADQLTSVVAPTGWRQHDFQRPRPPVIEPPAGPGSETPPADAFILFDGKNLDGWQSQEGGPAGWAVKDGYLEVTPGAGAIQTKAKFGDVQLHVEWAAPDPPNGVSQDRGNSGIFLMGQFELQVLDSYKADTYADGQAGAIYGQYPPLFNATRPPGQWQSYEIAFRRPRFDDAGKLISPARMTVFLNGVLVQDNEELWGQTSWLEPHPFDPGLVKGPIQLQDHSHPVRFRNIWLREIPERPAPTAAQLIRPKLFSIPAEKLDAYEGAYEVGPGAKDFRFTLKHVDNELRLMLPFRPTPLRLVPISDTVFVFPHTDARVTFRFDDQGKIHGCEFQVSDGRRPMTKTAP